MLQGKNALVTGSTRGIGAAIAEELAADGCNVMLSGFGEADAIEAERKRLADTYSVSVAYNPADLGKEEDVDGLFQAAEKAFGSVDILVNNAVIRYFHQIEDFPRDELRHAFAVNVTAAFMLIQNALPGMYKRGWGRIVNFSSVMGLAARSGRADYVMSKHALLGLTRATAAETGAYEGITCNAICPGSVITPNSDMKIRELGEEKGLDYDDARKLYLEMRHQKLDFIEPERIAKLVVFLCQESAMDISGAAISIDQGRVATFLEP
jgi:3-hydroxybutyrate dehydrogenase